MERWKTTIGTAVAAGITTIVFAQGSLTPPGAPGAMMKTLDQVEPRTPISSVPTNLTQSGSYYLTADLTAATGVNGITVSANDVTIDLNGYTLTRAGTASGSGIYQDGSYRNVRVCNGKIIGWTGGGNAGINARGENNMIDRVQASGNRVGLSGGHGVQIRNCRAFDNDSYGIYGGLNSSISGSTSAYNEGVGIFGYDGASVIGCNSYSNAANGIELLLGGTIRNCSAKSNQGDNIRVVGYCFVENNQCAGSLSGAGIHVADGSSSSGDANRIESNTVVDNPIGIHVENERNLIVRNSAGNNGTNYVIAANNKVGKIFSPPDCTVISGDSGGGFGNVFATDASFRPWANFVTDTAPTE